MSAEEGHGPVPPPSLFTGLYEHSVKGSWLDDFFGFSQADAGKPHLGQLQFESLCFSLIVVGILILIAFIGTKGYQRIPKPFRNFLEICVEGLRGMVRMLMGPSGDKFLPYLGSLFIFIFTMNLIGILPLFRSPTAVLSITGAMGITTFFFVQFSALRVNGIGGYIKHLAGPVIVLAPLMIAIELLGEIIKPCSLSLRLYGNINGEDTLIENFIHMGGWIPIHAPFLLLALFTSFLQAFIFTALTCIYLQNWTAHADEHHEESETAPAHH